MTEVSKRKASRSKFASKDLKKVHVKQNTANGVLRRIKSLSGSISYLQASNSSQIHGAGCGLEPMPKKKMWEPFDGGEVQS